MLNFASDNKIYLSLGVTDMRKGINGLSLLATDIISKRISIGSIFVFRGKRSDKIKILWWDGQGFCLFYKCLNKGKFTWPKATSKGSMRITLAQLSMLSEGIDWRNPTWSEPPEYMG
jgi:transposase